jgi:hypothetical protein
VPGSLETKSRKPPVPLAAGGFALSQKRVLQIRAVVAQIQYSFPQMQYFYYNRNTNYYSLQL